MLPSQLTLDVEIFMGRVRGSMGRSDCMPLTFLRKFLHLEGRVDTSLRPLHTVSCLLARSDTAPRYPCLHTHNTGLIFSVTHMHARTHADIRTHTNAHTHKWPCWEQCPAEQWTMPPPAMIVPRPLLLILFLTTSSSSFFFSEESVQYNVCSEMQGTGEGGRGGKRGLYFD